jgi:hypothetical protein
MSNNNNNNNNNNNTTNYEQYVTRGYGLKYWIESKSRKQFKVFKRQADGFLESIFGGKSTVSHINTFKTLQDAKDYIDIQMIILKELDDNNKDLDIEINDIIMPEENDIENDTENNEVIVND